MSSKPPRATKMQPQTAEQELIGNVLDDDHDQAEVFLKQLRSKMSPKNSNKKQPRSWKLQEAPTNIYTQNAQNGGQGLQQQFYGVKPGSGNSPPGSQDSKKSWSDRAAQKPEEERACSPSNSFRKEHMMEAVRPRSAPPKLTESPAKEPIHREDTPSLYIGGEKIAPDDYRLSPTYYAYYYSQRPLDPRLPKPLFDWSAWTSPQGTNSTFKPFHLPGRGKMAAPHRDGKRDFQGFDTTPTKAKPAHADKYQVPTPVRVTPPPKRLEARHVRSAPRHFMVFENVEHAMAETGVQQRDLMAIMASRDMQNGQTVRIGDFEFRLARTGEHGIDARGNYQQDPGMQGAYTGVSGQYSGGEQQRGIPPISVDTGSFRQPGEAQLQHHMARLQLASQNSPTHSPSQGPFGNHGMNRNGYVPPTLGYGGYSPVGVSPYSPGPMMAVMGYSTKEDDGEPTNISVPQLAAQYSPVSTPIVATSLPPPLHAQYSPSGPTILTAQYSPQAGPMTMLPPAAHLMQPQYQQIPGQSGQMTHNSQQRYPNPAQNYGRSQQQQQQPRGQGQQSSGQRQEGHRSQLLQELRAANLNKQPTLMDVVNQNLVAELSTDQNGSRFIQQRLEHATSQEKDAVFEQILPETIRLCTDVFGNYVIQKFFEFGTAQHKRMIAECLEERVLPLSLQMYGCRVIQKALEKVEPAQAGRLAKELDGSVIACVRDQNGNHVIQKVIEGVQAEHVQFIVDAFKGKTLEYSIHPYGCRVIQRLLEHVLEAQKAPLLEEILGHTVELCMDQYGNYVVQHILKNATKEWRSKVVNAISGHITAFSKHKFASNVVEKCFQIAEDKDKELLLQEIMGKGDSSPLSSLVRDQYGNYVIQKLLSNINPGQRSRLIRRITAVVPNIRKIAYGKHIISKIEKLTGKNFDHKH